MSDIWSSDIPNREIDGFPYPEKFCPYCNTLMQMDKVVHIAGSEELFKAIFVCWNRDCGVYDLESRKAYVKIYYSCQEALDMLEGAIFKIDRKDIDRGYVKEVY